MAAISNAPAVVQTNVYTYNFQFPPDASNYVWTLWMTTNLSLPGGIVPFTIPPTNGQTITNLNPIYFYKWKGNR